MFGDIWKKSFGSKKMFRATIQENDTPVSDGEGGFTQNWQDVKNVWVSINPLSAKQRYEYDSVDVEATHIIRTDYQNGIKETNRIKYEGRIFEIKNIRDSYEKGYESIIECREIRNAVLS